MSTSPDEAPLELSKRLPSSRNSDGENFRTATTATASLVKSLIAAAVLTCMVAGVVLYTEAPSSGSVFPLFLPSDRLPESQRQQRLAAFDKLPPISLKIIADDDLPLALESMQLSGQALQSLQADLVRNSSTNADAAKPSAGIEPQSLPAAATGSGPDPTPLGQPSPAAKEKPLQLAWITLWDTDAEDGDTVRIDSQGYSRSVVLTKAPLTFAIPVPADGVVKVIGVRDGDGGGITVGLASGGAKAVFPIMSEGQILGLRVRVN